MKKLALIFLFLTVVFFSSNAQKFAYVDTQYILDNLPEYTEAQAQLDDLSDQWQKEIETKFAEIDKMYKDFQAQSVLLPEDMKKKKEQEIVDKEKEAKNLQRQRFGKDGDMFKKRQELVKPIQEKIYNIIQEIATNNNYAIIFDKAGSLTMLYSNPKYDISDEILDNLGTSSTGRKGRNQPAAAGGQQGTPQGGQQGGQKGGEKSGEKGNDQVVPRNPKK